MPKPVQELLRVVHIERIDLSRINREDFDTLEYLKVHRPDVYQSARQEIAGKPTGTVVSIQSKKPPIELVGRYMPREHPEEMPLLEAFRR